MLIRDKQKVIAVDWGNGTSYRFLLEADQMGFTVCHTIVNAGTKSKLQYVKHLEACYCIAGSGWVCMEDTEQKYRLYPGVLYALDDHDPHYLIASPDQDLELLSIFNPPLQGNERHNLKPGGFSRY